MALRYALLGLVGAQPSTGYEIAQRFERSISNAWHASHSQIYPELTRLHAEGLIEVVSEGPRNSRTWGITPAGQEDLRRWLTRTEPNRSVRNESALRLFLVSLLEPAERRAVLERDLAYTEQELHELEQLAARLDAEATPSVFRPIVELGVRISPVMQEWLRDQIAASAEPGRDA
jgi:PadR family transcriptional regulator, regulatory protein AphA